MTTMTKPMAPFASHDLRSFRAKDNQPKLQMNTRKVSRFMMWLFIASVFVCDISWSAILYSVNPTLCINVFQPNVAHYPPLIHAKTQTLPTPTHS